MYTASLTITWYVCRGWDVSALSYFPALLTIYDAAYTQLHSQLSLHRRGVQDVCELRTYVFE
jgi:hypothetical protein